MVIDSTILTSVCLSWSNSRSTRFWDFNLCIGLWADELIIVGADFCRSSDLFFSCWNSCLKEYWDFNRWRFFLFFEGTISATPSISCLDAIILQSWESYLEFCEPFSSTRHRKLTISKHSFTIIWFLLQYIPLWYYHHQRLLIFYFICLFLLFFSIRYPLFINFSILNLNHMSCLT